MKIEDSLTLLDITIVEDFIMLAEDQGEVYLTSEFMTALEKLCMYWREKNNYPLDGNTLD